MKDFDPHSDFWNRPVSREEYFDDYSNEVVDFANSVSRIRRIRLLRDIEVFLGEDLKIQMSKGSTRAIKFRSIYTTEKTPSMKIWPDTRFKCFSTGEFGSWINIIDKVFEPSCEQHLLSICRRYVKDISNDYQLRLF